MTALQTLVTDYRAKQIAKASRAKAEILAARVAREALEEALGVLGHYVNTVANGSAATVELSGFHSYDTTRRPDLSPPAAPTELTLRQGKVSGSIDARYKSARKPSINEVQLHLGNPNDEAGWRMAGLFGTGSATITGLTPGTRVWVRVRTVGLKGVMGAWSDPAELMVI